MLIAAALLALAQAPAAAASPPQAVAALQGRTLNLPDEALAYVPANAGPTPPLLVLLHGAGRASGDMIRKFAPEADRRGIVLLAPTSRGVTWDVIAINSKPPAPGSVFDERFRHVFTSTRDSERVDQAIDALGKVVPIDRKRTALGGFSDGATFALAIGMSRYSDFSAVIAWSPGIPIENPTPARGRRVFVSHGRQDTVLSFDDDCDEIVPLLKNEGAVVTFLPFDGGHEVPKSAEGAFLDAVFGPAPGAPPPAPLPAVPAQCRSGFGAREIPVY